MILIKNLLDSNYVDKFIKNIHNLKTKRVIYFFKNQFNQFTECIMLIETREKIDRNNIHHNSINTLISKNIYSFDIINVNNNLKNSSYILKDIITLSYDSKNNSSNDRISSQLSFSNSPKNKIPINEWIKETSPNNFNFLIDPRFYTIEQMRNKTGSIDITEIVKESYSFYDLFDKECTKYYFINNNFDNSNYREISLEERMEKLYIDENNDKKDEFEQMIMLSSFQNSSNGSLELFLKENNKLTFCIDTIKNNLQLLNFKFDFKDSDINAKIYMKYLYNYLYNIKVNCIEKIESLGDFRVIITLDDLMISSTIKLYGSDELENYNITFLRQKIMSENHEYLGNFLSELDFSNGKYYNNLEDYENMF